MSEISHERAFYAAYVAAMPDAPAYAAWDDLDDEQHAATAAGVQAVLRDAFPRIRRGRDEAIEQLAEAEAETRKMRDIVLKLLDLFSDADSRRMRRADVTVATLERYAAEAGVRP
jgi:hypothetical protein